MSNSIVKATQTQITNANPKTLSSYIKSMQKEIEKALPSVMTPERFTRIVLSAVSSNPKLAETTPESFLGAMMQSAQLGMEVNTVLGQAYILPYENKRKGVVEAQFQLGYKGLIDLAYRSGEVESIQAQVVYENDKFNVQYGLEPKLEHIPADSNRGEAIKVYAMFRTKSGGYGFEVMSMDDIKAHAAKYSISYSNSYSPWKTNFEEMAKKTVLKRVLKYAPLKSDFVREVYSDETVKTTLSEDMFAVQPEPIIVDAETGEVVSEDGGNNA